MVKPFNIDGSPKSTCKDLYPGWSYASKRIQPRPSFSRLDFVILSAQGGQNLMATAFSTVWNGWFRLRY